MATPPIVKSDNPDVAGDSDTSTADALAAFAPSVPVLNSVPEKGTACLKFDPKNNSSYQITAAQLREAGIKKPFANEGQTEAVFGKMSGHMVPKDVFSKEAAERLLREPDISEVKSPGA